MVKITLYGRNGLPSEYKEIPGSEPEPAPPPKLEAYTLVGLDLGQRHDYTALAAIERQQLGDEPASYQVRQLKRWRQVPYTDIVREVTDRLTVWGFTMTDRLVVDETGVGVAVVDLFRIAKLPVSFTPVTITGGMEANPAGGGAWHVPKRDLISAVAVLLEQNRLTVSPKLPEAQTLVTELQGFQTKITAASNDVYGAWREGAHDDLVLAVALACWWGERPQRKAYVF